MDEGGGYSRIGVSVLPRVRLYRNGALTAGNSGVLKSLELDAASSWAQKLGYSHDVGANPEQITVDVPGVHLLTAAVCYDSSLLLTSMTVEIQADVGGGFAMVSSVTLPATGTALVASGVTTVVAMAAPLELLAGAVIRVQFSATGLNNAPLLVGDGITWFGATMVSS